MEVDFVSVRISQFFFLFFLYYSSAAVVYVYVHLCHFYFVPIRLLLPATYYQHICPTITGVLTWSRILEETQAAFYTFNELSIQSITLLLAFSRGHSQFYFLFPDFNWVTSIQKS